MRERYIVEWAKTAVFIVAFLVSLACAAYVLDAQSRPPMRVICDPPTGECPAPPGTPAFHWRLGGRYMEPYGLVTVVIIGAVITSTGEAVYLAEVVANPRDYLEPHRVVAFHASDGRGVWCDTGDPAAWCYLP